MNLTALIFLIFSSSLAFGQHSKKFAQIDKQKGIYGIVIGKELDSIFRFDRTNLNESFFLKEKYIIRKFESAHSRYGHFFDFKISRIEIFTDGNNIVNEIKFYPSIEKSKPTNDEYYKVVENFFGKSDSYFNMTRIKDSLYFKNEYIWTGKNIYAHMYSEYISKNDSSSVYFSIKDSKRIATRRKKVRFK